MLDDARGGAVRRAVRFDYSGLVYAHDAPESGSPGVGAGPMYRGRAGPRRDSGALILREKQADLSRAHRSRPRPRRGHPGTRKVLNQFFELIGKTDKIKKTFVTDSEPLEACDRRRRQPAPCRKGGVMVQRLLAATFWPLPSLRLAVGAAAIQRAEHPRYRGVRGAKPQKRPGTAARRQDAREAAREASRSPCCEPRALELRSPPTSRRAARPTSRARSSIRLR